MNNLAPGILSVHFGYAVILTAIISVILLAWYRRLVGRTMRIAARAQEIEVPSESDASIIIPAAGRSVGVDASLQECDAPPRHDESRLRLRLMTIYGAGGAAAAGVSTALFLGGLGDELRALRYLCHLVRLLLADYTYNGSFFGSSATEGAARLLRLCRHWRGDRSCMVGVNPICPRFHGRLSRQQCSVLCLVPGEGGMAPLFDHYHHRKSPT